MKIDIITLHNVKNYGSALQTYATQTIFEKLNYEVEVINYYRKDLIEENLVKKRIDSSAIFSKNIFTRLIGKVFLVPSINKQIKVFNNFLSENIHLTEKYYSNEELEKQRPKADIYCTGSDQVWNSEWNQGIERPFFLDFLPEKTPRIAYASSFGKTEIEQKEKDEIRKMLKKYTKIGVRENSALKLLEELGIKDATHVLDPTLLLKKEEWEKIKAEIKQKKEYILVYQLNSKNPEFDEYVKRLSKEKKMPIIRVSNVNYQALKYGGFAYCPTVNEFISYFLQASYIVTDSFHATGFAINFNKQFLCIFPKKFSTRLQSILELTNLEERKVTNFNNFDIMDKKINYYKVNEIIERERQKSIEYIKQAIASCEIGE